MSEIFYIVWRNDFVSYGENQGGYFVGYKDKCSDFWSTDYIMAKRYKSIGPAITRLFGKHDDMVTIRSFLNEIEKSKSIQRQKKLGRLLNKETNLSFEDISFQDGRIEKVELDGNTIRNLGDAKLEIYNHFLKKFETKIRKHRKTEDIEPLKVKVEEANINDEFWN